MHILYHPTANHITACICSSICWLPTMSLSAYDIIGSLVHSTFAHVFIRGASEISVIFDNFAYVFCLSLSEAYRRHLYQKLAPMHVTKIVRFDWSAAFESFWYQKLTPNRAVFYLVQVSATSILSMFEFE